MVELDRPKLMLSLARSGFTNYRNYAEIWYFLNIMSADFTNNYFSLKIPVLLPSLLGLMFKWKRLLLSFWWIRLLLPSVFIAWGQILFLSEKWKQEEILISETFRSSLRLFQNFSYCRWSRLEIRRRLLCKSFWWCYDTHLVRTLIIKNDTVSHIWSWMYYSPISTVLDEKSTPTVTLYYFENSPWMYFLMREVLPVAGLG